MDKHDNTPTVDTTVVTKRRERKKRNAEQLDADAKQLIENNAEEDDILSDGEVPF